MSYSNLHNISIGDVEEILELHWKTKNVLFLIGPPGIGKSDIVRQFGRKKAKELGRVFVEWFDIVGTGEEKKLFENPEKYFVLVDLKLYEYEPQDVKGIIYIDDANKKTVIIPWDWMKYFMLPKSAGILFLDELNMANPDTLKVAFQLVYQKVLANRRIRGDILIIAAGNPPEHNFLVIDLPEPLIDRMGIYYVYPDYISWLKWAIKNGVHPYIYKFIAIFPQYLFYDKGRSINKNIRISTPRSWTMLSNLIKELEKKYKNKATFISKVESVASGYIHPEALSKFIGFLRILLYTNFDELKQEILRNPNNIERYKENIELLYICLSIIAQAFADDEINKENLKNIINSIERLYKELSVVLVLEIIEKLKLKYKGPELDNRLGEFLDLLRFEFPDLYEIILRVL